MSKYFGYNFFSRLYTFPTEKGNNARRQRWIQILQRYDPAKPDYLLEPRKSHRVCSDHFINGVPTEQYPDPSLKLGLKRVHQEPLKADISGEETDDADEVANDTQWVKKQRHEFLASDGGPMPKTLEEIQCVKEEIHEFLASDGGPIAKTLEEVQFVEKPIHVFLASDGGTMPKTLEEIQFIKKRRHEFSASDGEPMPKTLEEIQFVKKHRHEFSASDSGPMPKTFSIKIFLLMVWIISVLLSLWRKTVVQRDALVRENTNLRIENQRLKYQLSTKAEEVGAILVIGQDNTATIYQQSS